MLWIIYALIALVLAALFQISIMIMSSYDKTRKNLSSKLVSSLWLFVIIGIIASIGLFGMNMYGINTSITYITEYRPLLLFSAFALMTYEMLLIFKYGCWRWWIFLSYSWTQLYSCNNIWCFLF